MNMEFRRKLPGPEEVIQMYPVIGGNPRRQKAKNDEEIRKIFTGESDKLLLVIGPCSADREDAVLDYISRLRPLQEKVQDKIVIVPRIYTNKPRTTGIGYKGMLHQSDPHRPAGYAARPDGHSSAACDLCWPKRAFPARMKCCTRKIIGIWRMCFPMWQSGRVRWKISKTG